MKQIGIRARASFVMACSMVAFVPVAAQAQAPSTSTTYTSPAQDLGSALTSLGRKAGRETYFSADLTRGKRAPAIKSVRSWEEALRRLLVGSDLTYRITATGAIVIEAASPAAPRPVASESVEADTAIVVTGSRIRGANTPSPVIRISRAQIKEEGFNDPGEVMRSIPQNFNGGQNPGVAQAVGGGIANQNVTSGSSPNLRGLGSDATLTLLNGRRLAYSGFSQAVDISNIPLAAIDRIEIVSDGASAIYGSDAVAGVVNVVTRRDYKGLTTTASYGGATSGGLETWSANATLGSQWTTGGLVLAADYRQADPIFSSQRPYTAYMADPSTLYPGIEQASLFLSANQELAPTVRTRVDALYSRRSDETFYAQQIGTSRTGDPYVESSVVMPSVEWAFTPSWTATLGGTIGRDRNMTDFLNFDEDNNLTSRSRACDCNRTFIADVGMEGPIVQLPAGSARLAVGAGYRRDRFESKSFTSDDVTGGRQSSHFIYGELSVPLLSEHQNSMLGKAFSVTAAVRYEDYDSFGSVTTPKFGFVYDLSSSISLKGSWGKSFKTPTLLQQNQAKSVFIFDAALLGSANAPVGATALMTFGGNDALKPERAETFTVTASFKPHFLEGMKIDIGAFDISYSDRIVVPIDNFGGALSDPRFDDFVRLNPDAASLDAAIASADRILNLSSGPFDAAGVVAIVTNSYTNATVVKMRGIDVSASYSIATDTGNIVLRGSGAYLDGKRALSPSQPSLTTTGTIFNPPKFRFRAGAVWNRDDLTSAIFVNHSSSVRDDRVGSLSRLGSMTTFDASVSLGLAGVGLNGTEVALSAQNIFNRKPPLFTGNFDETLVNFDSTNHSAIGRYLSISFRREW